MQKDVVIYKQAAIDAVEKHACNTQRILDAISALPSAQPEQRWIPCSERMPEENGQYLITVKYEHEAGYDDIYAEHGDWSDGEWDMFCFGHCGKVESIIAWMPLPDPFREEGDE